MSILNEFTDIKLTADQSRVIQQLEAFLSGNKNVFLLKGYAGTGKTTLLKGICNYLSSQQKDFNLFAPTGRAAMVSTSKTAIAASTIHRGVYNLKKLEESQEGDTFKFKYGLAHNEDSSACVYLVDEASMISDIFSENEFFTFGSGKLLQDLTEFVFDYEHSNHRKIVFIGDTAQLPPVNMNFSPALNANYLSEKYNLFVEEAQLTQVVRQGENSGILSNATALRNAISQNTFNTFQMSPGTGIGNVEPADFLQEYFKAVKNAGINNTIVITHSNKQALAYNLAIRELRYGNSVTTVQKKDKLLITKNSYRGFIDLFNGMFVELIEFGDISYHCTPRFKIRGGKTVERELIFRDILVEVTDHNQQKHRLRTTLLEKFLTTEEGSLHPHDQRALYIDFKNRMKERNIRSRTVEFKEALRNDIYFNALQVKYGYAVTCHKSQGGEWDTVFTDFKVYMGKYTAAFFRWTYTAVTRSNNRLYCIDAPQYDALSNIIYLKPERLSKIAKGTFYMPLEADNPNYFVEYRSEKISELCTEFNINLHISPKNNQLDITFSREEKTARVQLWFGNGGFTKTSWLQQPEANFKSDLDKILLDSLLFEDIPFIPKFPFQNDLHNYLTGIFSESEVPITNIIQQDWSDRYFIRTDADCAFIEYYFDSAHKYTKAIVKSTLGADDKKLTKLLEKLEYGVEN